MDETAAPTRRNAPRWLSISLLIASTVAIAAPIILLRRHHVKQRLIGKVQTEPIAVKSAVVALRPTVLTKATPDSQLKHSDDSNVALYAARALGIATFFVGAGAATALCGVKHALGVRDVPEFADRMRTIIHSAMPTLVDRIHRPTDNAASLVTVQSADENTVEWNWPEAERRIWQAYDKEGFVGWFKAALIEVEAEAEVERRKMRVAKREKRDQ